MSVQLQRRYFNVGEYYRMAEAGILSRTDRVELIEGEIIRMCPIGSYHAAYVDKLNRLLSSHANKTAIVRVQNPVRLNDYSEPEPDISLLRWRDDFYAVAHPGPADVWLLMEVMDSSGAYDRGVKLGLYARAGIPEVWLIDVQQKTAEIHAQAINGVYQDVQKAGRAELLTSRSLPELAISVDAIFG